MAYGFLKFFVRLFEVNRSRRQLANLSDEGLRDIGLSRSQVETEIARPPWDSVNYNNSPLRSHANLTKQARSSFQNSFRA